MATTIHQHPQQQQQQLFRQLHRHIENDDHHKVLQVSDESNVSIFNI